MTDHPATTDTNTGTIVVIGSINVDLVVRVASLPRPGETVLGGRFASVPGGKGANQAVAAARAGGHTTFVARVGDDSMGRAAIDAFRAEGIKTDFISITPHCPTGVALILVDAAGENSIAVAGGANDRLSREDIERARPAIAAADVVLLQLEIPLEAVAHAVEIARAAGRRVILNPAPARPLPATLLAGIDILTPNETEATALAADGPAGEASAADIEGIARTLLDLGPRAVVVTLGAAGALVATGQGLAQVPAFPVEPRDTVAAGDVFNGSLAVMLAEGHDLVAATRFAAAAAAISVTREGAQASAPHRSEIEAFLTARLRPEAEGA
jgi:ribokinase